MNEDEDERGFFGEQQVPSGRIPVPTTRAARSGLPLMQGIGERLRQRFQTAGADALADYELLELFLFRSFPRQDTKPLAKALIAHFGSLAEVVGAPQRLLEEVKGVGPAAALEIKVAERRSPNRTLRARSPAHASPSWTQVLDYCRADPWPSKRAEQFRILFLDKKNALIADEVQAHRNGGPYPGYPREVVRRALELSASR